MKADIYLAMKYERLVMRLEEICHEIGAEVGTVRNRMSAGTFPIPTRKEGKFVVADVRDVGKYIDDRRDESTQSHPGRTCARIKAALPPTVSPAEGASDELWDMGDVAAYLKHNAQVVRESMACLPSFPKAIRLPSKGRAQPLYLAAEVREWANKFKDRD